MSDDLISRSALMKRLKTQIKQITPIEESRDMFFHDSGVNGAITGAWLEAKNAPAVDAVEVVHGKWRKVYVCSDERLWAYRCDKCNAENPRGSYYCPNCGAKMDGGSEDG